jgi:hypothetical protein
MQKGRHASVRRKSGLFFALDLDGTYQIDPARELRF